MAMDMRGSLNLSKFYTKSNQPKFYGKAMVEGKEYLVKGWEKIRSDTGEVWVSLLFEPTEIVDDFTSPELKKPTPYSTPSTPQHIKKIKPVKQPEWREDDIPF